MKQSAAHRRAPAPGQGGRSRSGRALVYVLKWLAAPIILAAVGFFIIGPRVTKPHADTGPTPPPTAEVDPSADVPKKHSGEPKVDISAAPVRRTETSRSRRRRRTEAPRNLPSTTTEQPPGASNSEEPPSGGGA